MTDDRNYEFTSFPFPQTSMWKKTLFEFWSVMKNILKSEGTNAGSNNYATIISAVSLSYPKIAR